MINSGPGCSCDPLRAGTRCSSLDGSQGQQNAQPWIPWPAAANVGKSIDSGPGATAIHAGRVGVPSSDQRRPGQQLRSLREGTRCTTMDPSAGSMHNPGFKASSMQTSANIRRTSANQGQQLRSPAGRDSMQSPRWIHGPAAANVGKSISAEPVGSCDPWGPGCSSIK